MGALKRKNLLLSGKSHTMNCLEFAIYIERLVVLQQKVERLTIAMRPAKVQTVFPLYIHTGCDNTTTKAASIKMDPSCLIKSSNP